MANKVHRQWLTPATSSSPKSFVMVDIEEHRGEYQEHSLTIGDCDRNISLYFPTDKKKRTASKAKLTKVQEALNLLWEEFE
jgi:hypothetical protein